MNVLLKADCEIDKDLKVCFICKFFEVIVNEDYIYDEDNIIAVIDNNCPSLEEATRNIINSVIETSGYVDAQKCIELIIADLYEIQICNEECEVLYVYALNKDMVDEMYNKVFVRSSKEDIKNTQAKYKNQIKEVL